MRVTPLLALLVASLAAGGFAERDALPASIGTAVGMGLVPFIGALAVTLLLSFLYWLVKRTIIPGFYETAWLVWTLLTFLMLWGSVYRPPAGAARDVAGYTYSPEGCEFAVPFPGTPSITTVTTEPLGELERADFAQNAGEQSAFFRAECAPVPGPLLARLRDRDGEVLHSLVVEYAQMNGLDHLEHWQERGSLGLQAGVRGMKRVDGVPVTAQLRFHVGEKSLLTLMTVGRSSGYPQKGVSEFQTSAAHSML